MKKTIYAILGCMTLAACEPTLIAEFEDKPVVSCYLDAGYTPTLTVSKLIAFRDDAAYSDEDVNGLSIIIADETVGVDYPMQSVGDGRYEYPLLIAEVGHTYTLRFNYNGKAISASTTVPEAPQNVEFSATTIGIMAFELYSSRAAGDGINITWRNNDRNYYIVEGFTDSDTQLRESDTDPDKNFKLDYTQGNSATISQTQFNYIGTYEVSLIRIHSEYAVLSQGSSDSSTSLEDVRGNIDGGYGIFTGINRVVQSINVYKDTNPF